MTHLQCNSEFASKDEYQLAFASGSLSFIVKSPVGGRLVMINKVALIILQIASTLFHYDELSRHGEGLFCDRLQSLMHILKNTQIHFCILLI